VTSNPDLNAAEKETGITMYGDDRRMKIFSSKATVVKSLLQHDHFEAEWFGGSKNDCYQRRESGHEEDLDAIYSICGTAPIGMLTVKSKPRSNNHQSSIVNHKGVDPEAFA
jgi:hypothetical protein